MAVLSATRLMQYKMRTDPRGDTVELPVVAGDIIYGGSFVGRVAAGHVQPYLGSTIGTTLTGFDKFVGIALEEVDNSAGAAAAKTCKILTSGCFYTAISGLALTDVGAAAYISDQSTVTLAAAGNTFIGWVERFEASGYGWVRLAGPENQGGHPVFRRMSAEITVTAANKCLLIHPSENRSGLLMRDVWATVQTVLAGGDEDQPVITIEDTDGTDITTISFTDGGADVQYDLAVAAASPLRSALGVLMVPVAADKGIQAFVSTPTSGAGAAGGVKVFIEAIPFV